MKVFEFCWDCILTCIESFIGYLLITLIVLSLFGFGMLIQAFVTR